MKWTYDSSKAYCEKWERKLTTFAIVSILSAIVFMPLLTSCGTVTTTHTYQTRLANGQIMTVTIPSNISGLSCSSIGIGTRPTQADIDLCKKYLAAPDGSALQILWEEFDEVDLDGVHTISGDPYGGTCPIIVLYPIESGHTNGTISDADFAKQIYDFYRAKFQQNLNGKQSEAKSRLVAAGLPVPVDH